MNQTLSTEETTEKPEAEADCSAPPCSPCECWRSREKKLEELHGLTISKKCKQMVIREKSIDLVYGLPLEKADGSRMKKSDPGFMQISHCPFCGVKY